MRRLLAGLPRPVVRRDKIGLPRVQRFNGTTGNFISAFATNGGVGLPIGVCYGPDANLYVASFNTHRVVRYDSISGEYLGDFVTNGSGGLLAPNFMVFRPPVTPAPVLSIAGSATNAILTWPVKNVPGVLQKTEDLANPDWLTVSNPVFVVSSSNTVSVPRTDTNEFFRLRMTE
jgi:hypothetical protein